MILKALDHFIRDAEEIIKGASLDACIMLNLAVNKSEEPISNSQVIEKHELSLSLEDTATYTTDLRQIKFVEESGITVPSWSGVIASIHHMPLALANSNSLIIAQDNDQSSAAVYEEVVNAFNSLKEYVEELEAVKTIKLRQIAPEAGRETLPLTVRIRGFGDYFNRFKHKPGTSLPEHYHTSYKDMDENTEIEFVPGTRQTVKHGIYLS